MTQTIKTAAGETLVVLSLTEFEDLRDAADHVTALAAAGSERLTQDEILALLDAPTPLAFWRRKREMTQTQLAKIVGVSQSYIADIERGARKGDPALIKRLAVALKVAMEILVPDEAPGPR